MQQPKLGVTYRPLGFHPPRWPGLPPVERGLVPAR
jgi:hypothetical protein